MSYLSGNPPESWELEEEQFLTSIVPRMSYGRRIAVLLTVGMVAAIEISNRLSINVFLPDMQGNVGASSDEISWVIILYNVGLPLFPCDGGLDDARHGRQAPLAVEHRDLCRRCDGLRAQLG